MLPTEEKLDPRVKRTRALILQSFESLIAEKGFETISVQDVTDKAQVNRATFYAHFALEPKGKHVIRICDGTACHVKQSLPVLNALHEKLGTSEKNKTTADMMFTVETVACLGACGLAPVIVVDEQVYGQITPEQAVALVDEIKAMEAVAAAAAEPAAEQPSAEEACA